MGQDDLVAAVGHAAAIIRAWTGNAASEYFDNLREVAAGPPEACHAVGVIEGAAIALGMTPIELLDDLGIEGS